MVVYFAILFWLTLACCISSRKKALSAFIFRLDVVLLAILAGLRAISVGTDTVSYLESFNELAFSEIRGIEIGWFFLNYLVKITTGSYRVLLLTVSALTLFFVRKSIEDVSRNKNLSLLLFVALYFYFESFNIMRQILAASVVLYATKYIIRQDFKRYLFWVLLAATVHTSAIVMLIMYAAPRWKIGKVVVIGCVALSFIAGPFLFRLFSSILSRISVYGFYLDREAYLKESGYFSFNLLLQSLVFLFILLVNADTSREYNLLINLFFIGTMISNILAFLPVFARMGIFFKVSGIFLLANLKSRLVPRRARTLSLYSVVLIEIAACAIMLIWNTEGVLPYTLSLS